MPLDGSAYHTVTIAMGRKQSLNNDPCFSNTAAFQEVQADCLTLVFSEDSWDLHM